MSALEMVDANLRAAMSFFGYATGSGQIVEAPGVLIIDSGLNYGVFNLALLTGPCADLRAAIAGPADYFRPRERRWSFWVCEDWLARAVRRTAPKLFTELGFRTLSHPPGMIAERLATPRRILPEIECRAVSELGTRHDFLAISSVCFDIPERIARAVYEPDSAWSGDYRGFVAYAGGEPVATVAIVAAADALGVYSLGTLPGRRRHGYGEALLRAALGEMRVQTGIDHTVLQSTDIGFGLYKRMGYREITRYSVYLSA